MLGPLVSIIIPCFNAERWIGEAIGSALAQTWPATEVIVIDDGSTDASLDVVRSFGPAVRWATGANRGGGAARNRGLALARGDWIQFLDADDVLLPDCVAHKLAEPVGRGQVAFCDVTLFGEAADAAPPRHWSLHDPSLEDLLRHGAPQTAAPLHRRTELEAIGGFRESLRCGQDLDLHLRLAIERRLTFVSTGRVGVRLRVTPHSLSRSAGAAMWLAVAEVLRHSADSLHRDGRLTAERRAIIAQRNTRLARKLWRMGRRDRAAAVARHARILSDSWHQAIYRHPGAPWLARVLGFSAFEHLHQFWRRLRSASLDSTEHEPAVAIAAAPGRTAATAPVTPAPSRAVTVPPQQDTTVLPS